MTSICSFGALPAYRSCFAVVPHILRRFQTTVVAFPPCIGWPSTSETTPMIVNIIKLYRHVDFAVVEIKGRRLYAYRAQSQLSWFIVSLDSPHLSGVEAARLAPHITRAIAACQKGREDRQTEIWR